MNNAPIPITTLEAHKTKKLAALAANPSI